MSDLLFEIGTEEIPAGFLIPATEKLEELFRKKIEALNLAYGEVKTFCTPRRLALKVVGIAERQDDRKEVLMGPSKQAAYDAEGNPTKAAEGFARSKGATVDDLMLVDTPKGQYLQLERELKGVETSKLLPAVLKEIILELPFAKSMKWGSNQHTFARPIQWLMAMLDDQVVELEHEGIIAGRKSRGHRFMSPDYSVVPMPAAYQETMQSVSVIADYQQRKEAVLHEIRTAVKRAVFSQDAEVAIDEGLLDTVTNLVEKPYGVCGHFDEKFLQLPDEVLITSMREHQKYFPVVDQDGSLLPGFVAVNNTGVSDYNLTREGHERVLRARLEDALFFLASDRKTKLADRVASLEGIIFQNKLGSMKEKTDRIVKLAGMLGEMLESENVKDSCRAALLCKADLITDMVGEFPTLQGVMGGAYALHDGEKDAVAQAVREHYMPVRAGAPLPQSAAGAIVALADRIDTIAGCFGIGQQPTGTADPFGLRRLSIAVLHIIEDRGYSLSLKEVFTKALALYGERVDGSAATVDTIVSFIKLRFENEKTASGIDSRAVEAVTSVVFDDVNDCISRIKAFGAIKQETSFEVLAGSFKRVRNIVKDNAATEVDETLLVEKEEKELWQAFKGLERDSMQGLQDKDYLEALKSMLVLKDPVDRFFDEVMVMAEDDSLRANRLNMLTAIGNHILKVGDISRMHAG